MKLVVKYNLLKYADYKVKSHEYKSPFSHLGPIYYAAIFAFFLTGPMVT